jgi:PPOX class probable F420-dependent enzyme
VPKLPLPKELDDFLTQPNPSVIASVRPDGSPHTAATWYLWEDGRVIVNMEESRKRLDYMRQDPRVSITVTGKGDDWYHHVTLRGRISLEPDPDFEVIDRLCNRYMGGPYSDREHGRVTGYIEVESWHSWAGGAPWTGSD